jgi:VIT1/CCC1 family predicted Fe2+/Mn2+ transporter
VSSSIKPSFQQYDDRDYDASFGDGVWQSIKVSTVLSFFYSVFIFILGSNKPLFEFFAITVAWFVFLSIITGFITLIATNIIAKPAVAILNYFNLADEISAAILSGLITFAVLMWFSSGKFIAFYYAIIFWGIACGYAFMNGYKKGAKK